MFPARIALLKKSLEAVVLPVLALLVLALWPATLVAYPWWWLAPLAIALRYGVVFGIVSGLVLLLGNFIGQTPATAATLLSSSSIVGGFIATYLGGLYASHSRNRLIEANARLEYLEQRLESLTRVFYVTRLSHSRLEENLITQSYGLRNALEAISRDIGDVSTDMDALPREPMHDMLQLLAFYGRLGTAAIFPVHDGRPQRDAIATLGPAFTLDTHDPLIGDVIERDQPAYYSVDQILNEQVSAYRAVFPLVAADETILGLIVVLEMPLLAVDEENLLTLAAMVAFVADALRASQLSAAVRASVPACPPDFALEWTRLGHLRQRARVRSAWVMLEPGASACDSVSELIYEVRRGLDQYWSVKADDSRSPLLVLLPLTGEGAMEGFLQRIDSLCQERLGATLDALGWKVRQGQIEQGSGSELARVIARGGTHAHS